jgi:hypothetical protein
VERERKNAILKCIDVSKTMFNKKQAYNQDNPLKNHSSSV